MLLHKNNKSYLIDPKRNYNFLNSDNYFFIPDGSELYKKVIESNGEFEYVIENDELVDITYTITLERKNKIEELETYIANVKETGVEYQGKWFKCDDECKNNITQSMIFIDSLLPLTWFTRNGEQGTVTFTTKEEFLAFVQVIAGKLAEIQNSYYQYKYAIEQAQTEEELNNIVFGGGSNDTQEE